MNKYTTYEKYGRVYIEANHRFSRIKVSGKTKQEALKNYYKAIGASL
jgi:hypothetical protein